MNTTSCCHLGRGGRVRGERRRRARLLIYLTRSMSLCDLCGYRFWACGPLWGVVGDFMVELKKENAVVGVFGSFTS
jgi:hypothetical protein